VGRAGTVTRDGCEAARETACRLLRLLGAENIAKPIPLLLVRRIVEHLPQSCLRLPFGFVLFMKHGSVT